MSRIGQRTRISLVAAMLCICSLAQLSIANLVFSYAKRLIDSTRAEPPLAVSMAFGPWLSMTRLPWKLAVVVLYASVCVWSLRKAPENAFLHLVVLWLMITTVFFVALWVASLPYRLCCI
jgi:hypothetical protein